MNKLRGSCVKVWWENCGWRVKTGFGFINCNIVLLSDAELDGDTPHGKVESVVSDRAIEVDCELDVVGIDTAGYDVTFVVPDSGEVRLLSQPDLVVRSCDKLLCRSGGRIMVKGAITTLDSSFRQKDMFGDES